MDWVVFELFFDGMWFVSCCEGGCWFFYVGELRGFWGFVYGRRGCYWEVYGWGVGFCRGCVLGWMSGWYVWGLCKVRFLCVVVFDMVECVEN